MKFEGLLPALVTGNIDFIVAELLANEERKETIEFSITYYEGLQRFLIRAGILSIDKGLQSQK